MSSHHGSSRPGGELRMQVLREAPFHLTSFRGLLASIRRGLPQRGLPREVNEWREENQRHLLRGVAGLAFDKLAGIPHFYGVLYLRKLCSDGLILDLGVASHQLITTAGVNKIVSGLNAVDTTTFPLFKFHGFGSGATAPAIGDTALQTEYTTEYNPNSTRPTGSQTVGGSNNIYRTVGTFTPDASVTTTEMGLLSQAATGGGTLLDRFTYTGVPLNGTGDALQTTVDITFPAGS